MVRAKLPAGDDTEHPFVIITCNGANSKENFYTGVMMTHSGYQDQFGFPINSSMFEGSVDNSLGQIRLYIFTSFREDSVMSWKNRMKMPFFENLMKQIKEFILATDK